MTTPTPAEVGHGSKEPTVVEIDGFRGRLISADHADYDIARAVWNGAIDRRPHLIARCIGTADVVAAVRFARDHDLEIAIRGGGHNVAGTAVCDDGIVIDLSAMRAVRVDPTDRRAWVQGGALWGDVDHETQAHGLATTGGIVSHTGVAGLTLGGGVGWLMRKHGLTVDNLLAVDVVTADGELLRASEDEHPDLFWALRGGGGNFGVVTSFEFRLHSVGPTVLAGPILWDATDAGEVLRFGNAGDDTINGGAANDFLFGGTGDDMFIFTENFGNDWIIGFDANPIGGQDQLDISALAANAVGVACRPACGDPHLAAFAPPQLLEPLQESRDAGLPYRSGSATVGPLLQADPRCVRGGIGVARAGGIVQAHRQPFRAMPYLRSSNPCPLPPRRRLVKPHPQSQRPPDRGRSRTRSAPSCRSRMSAVTVSLEGRADVPLTSRKRRSGCRRTVVRRATAVENLDDDHAAAAARVRMLRFLRFVGIGGGIDGIDDSGSGKL